MDVIFTDESKFILLEYKIFINAKQLRKYCANGGGERCYEYVGVFQVRNLVLVECYDRVPDRQENMG